MKLPLVFALALLPLACSSAPEGAVGTSASAVTSPTTTYLLPVDDGVREACRATWTTGYCQSGDAQAAADACVSSYLASGASPACASQSEGCFQLLTQNTACAADAPIYPSTSSCQAPVDRTCAFYSQCLEAAKPCGESGYAIGYGEKYCSRYDVEAGFSAEGVVWRNATLHCLQEALVPVLAETSTMSCDAITDFAFNSHPHCYTEGPSIRFLPPTDALNVLRTIDGKDILSLRSAKQMVSVAGTCIFQIGGAIFHFDQGERPMNVPAAAQDRATLNDRLLFWQDVAAHGVDGVSRN